MRAIICLIMASAVATFFFASCAMEPSRVEMDYGVSQRLAIANQTLNPDADKNQTPVAGLDGLAGQKAYDQYLKSFEKSEKQPVYQLGIIGQGSK
ncbi:hypothetical protein [Syntrophorhabdus aromaticivorans]|uniref:Pilus assembly protein n=1 Tax=Syntrophorhabdus aromaticivorans TaxID=328301 RepID=A0A971M7A2_9BACT|nr:hypothetical protein [Syntrophorhabdus aromaticivorans]NLW36491.1 hypothetical protein [Syntrophorhabdus aromaticivorans]